MSQQPNNALSVPQELDWAALTDEVAELVDLGKLPPKALEALPYLMAGLPKTEVARIVKVTRPTLNDWLRQNPALQIAVDRGKELAATYRLSMLEGQFIQALKVSEKLLGVDFEYDIDSEGNIVDPEGKVINAKLATAIGQHARFILNLFVSSKHDVTVTHELGDSVLDAQKDALSYVAQQIASLSEDNEPIDVAYRIIDGNPHNEGPMLRADGTPNYGTLGVLNTDDGLGTQCHTCGQWFKSLGKHIRSSMQITLSEYELVYALEPGTVSKVSP